jgi:hypothetical protein
VPTKIPPPVPTVPTDTLTPAATYTPTLTNDKAVS